MHFRFFHFFAAILFLFASTAPIYAAEFYVWIDDDGKRHITDVPPEKPAKIIKHERYGENIPEESQNSEMQQGLKKQQDDRETEPQKSIN